MQKNRGFTLIELLVVIAIIATLSSIIMASFRSAQDKAKNAFLVQEKVQVTKGLLAYYADKGTYPSTPGGGWFCLGPSTTVCWNSGHNGLDSLWAQVSPYFASIPTPNAIPGTYAYNGYKYESPATFNGVPSSSVLLWMKNKDTPMTTSECPPPSVIDNGTDTVYSYCWMVLPP